MGINFNKNSFGKLTTAKLNQSKAAKNAGNIADTKASNAAKEGNSLNSATLKSNQGLKIDSNTLFDKMGDVVPANDNPPVKKAEEKKDDSKDNKKTDIRDEKAKIGNIGKKIKDSALREMQSDKTNDNVGAAIAYGVGCILDAIGI